MCVLCEAERPGHHNVRSVLRHYAPRKGRHLPCALKAAIRRRQKARSLSTRLLLLLQFPATTCTSPCACAMPKNSLTRLTFPCRRSRSRRALPPPNISASSSSGRPASPHRATGRRAKLRKPARNLHIKKHIKKRMTVGFCPYHT